MPTGSTSSGRWSASACPVGFVTAADCRSRAFPPLEHRLALDPTVEGAAPYRFETARPAPAAAVPPPAAARVRKPRGR